MARTQADRKADTRARLLAAASALFAERGFHGTSTDAVADAADRTSGAVYAHFGGKEGLLLALLEAWEAETSADTGAALAGAGDLDGRLGALWDAFLASRRGAHGDGVLLEHELWLYAARHPEVGETMAQRFASARRTMGPVLETWASDDGEELAVDGRRTATLVLALLLGLEMQHRLDPTAVPDDLPVAGLALLFGRAPADIEDLT